MLVGGAGITHPGGSRTGGAAPYRPPLWVLGGRGNALRAEMTDRARAPACHPDIVDGCLKCWVRPAGRRWVASAMGGLSRGGRRR